MRKYWLRRNCIFAMMAMFLSANVHAQVISNSTELMSDQRAISYVFSRPMINMLYQHGVVEDRKFGLQQGCQTEYKVRPIGVSILQPIDFPQDKQNPLKGIWNFRYSLERCGETKVYNSLFFADQNGEVPKAKAYFPGSSNASPLLIKDAMVSGMGMAMVNAKQKACKEIVLFDMQVTEEPHTITKDNTSFKNVWSEKWVFKACGEMVDTYVTFTPDLNGSGTSFSFHAK
ncbi:hypothetical protein [Sulfurospirillum oryzae]|uniref:hypothetical protein n=1 Tax=Sulfurospirillum oryzae TaxID=2976535 RepID=UPI0021E6F691|nr:hypothetical protein [Sulfurospirillum oryzae]